MGRSDSKSGRDDQDEKMGGVVLDEVSWYEMVWAREVPEPFEGSIRTHRVV